MREKKAENVAIGDRLLKARLRANLSQKELAHMADMDEKNYSSVERGMTGLSIQSLIRICNAMNISTDSILLGDNSKNDVDALTDRLARLSPKQFETISVIINKVLEAFQQ